MEIIGIKTPILDILVKLRSIGMFQTVRIWNGQIGFEVDGKYPNFAKPAAFLEIINDVKFEQLGTGYQSADVGWRVHVCHEYYDAQDGTFEQDIAVFDLRDAVTKSLSFYEPTGCGPLVRTSETQDYEHDNIYHYIIDFACSFTDNTGSKEAQGKFITKQAPTDLQLDVYAETELLRINYERTFPITFITDQNKQVAFHLPGDLDVRAIEAVYIDSEPLKRNEFTYNSETGNVELSLWLALVPGVTVLIIYSKTA